MSVFDSKFWLLRFAEDVASVLTGCALGVIDPTDNTVQLDGQKVSYGDYLKYLLHALTAVGGFTGEGLTTGFSRAATTGDVSLSNSPQTVLPCILPAYEQLKVLLTVPRKLLKGPVQSPTSKPAKKIRFREEASEDNKLLAERLPVRMLRTAQVTVAPSYHARFNAGGVAAVLSEENKLTQDEIDDIVSRYLQGVLPQQWAKYIRHDIVEKYLNNELSPEMHQAFEKGGDAAVEQELRELGKHCNLLDFGKALSDWTEFSDYKIRVGEYHYVKRSVCKDLSVITCGFPVLVRGLAVDSEHFPAFNKSSLESGDDMVWLILDLIMRQSVVCYESLRRFLDVTDDCLRQGITYPKLQNQGGSLLVKPSIISKTSGSNVLTATLVSVPKFIEKSSKMKTQMTLDDWNELWDESWGYTRDQWEELYEQTSEGVPKPNVGEALVGRADMTLEEWNSKRNPDYTAEEWSNLYTIARNRTLRPNMTLNEWMELKNPNYTDDDWSSLYDIVFYDKKIVPTVEPFVPKKMELKQASALTKEENKTVLAPVVAAEEEPNVLQSTLENETALVPFTPSHVVAGEDVKVGEVPVVAEEKPDVTNVGEDVGAEDVKVGEVPVVAEEKPDVTNVGEVAEPSDVRSLTPPEKQMLEGGLEEYDELRSVSRFLTGTPIAGCPTLMPLRQFISGTKTLQGGGNYNSYEKVLIKATHELQKEIRRRSKLF